MCRVRQSRASSKCSCSNADEVRSRRALACQVCLSPRLWASATSAFRSGARLWSNRPWAASNQFPAHEYVRRKQVVRGGAYIVVRRAQLLSPLQKTGAGQRIPEPPNNCFFTSKFPLETGFANPEAKSLQNLIAHAAPHQQRRLLDAEPPPTLPLAWKSLYPCFASICARTSLWYAWFESAFRSFHRAHAKDTGSGLARATEAFAATHSAVDPDTRHSGRIFYRHHRLVSPILI